MAAIDRGDIKVVEGKYPVEIFYILEGQGRINKNNTFQNLEEDDIFEIRRGEKAEITGYSNFEFFHLAFPHRYKNISTFKTLGRQISALQYCTKNNLCQISKMDKKVKDKIINEGIALNTDENFGLSEPENVKRDSESLFKTILKNYSAHQKEIS